jgi:hypothetical protein
MDLFKAIRDLYAEKKRLEDAIASLEQLLEAKAATAESSQLGDARQRRGRKSMGPEERRRVSERMKKYWAAKRSGQAARV